jgi:hypothetical protein
MTPEERAATVLDPLGNWFASNPKVVAGVANAIAAAERAAYERAAEVCNGENAAWREMWDGQPIYYACAGAIRALIDKEPT